MSHNHTWEEAQAEELAFWNTPGAELGEQLKQLSYASYLGLQFEHDGNSPYVINKAGLSIIDIGGGPVSLLLKTTTNPEDFRLVVDPCTYPEWVRDRYSDAGIDYCVMPAEKLYGDVGEMVDEVWLYNVLQHTLDPQKIFDNIYATLKEGGVFRFLDWIDTPTNVAHPVTLTIEEIMLMLETAGFKSYSVNSATLNENGAVGKIAFGVFKK